MADTRASSWGRGPLWVAGLVTACLLGALVAIAIAAVTDDLGWLLVAAVLVVLALGASAVLTVLLVRDRFPREILARLDDLERRVGSSGRPVGGTASAADVETTGPPEVTVGLEPSAEPLDPDRLPAAVAVAAPPTPPVRTPDTEPATEPTAASPGGGPARPRGSVEALLGGRALGIAGAVVLVIAAGLFLKFAWDQGWFRPSPAARVALGVVTGFAMVAIGEIGRRRDGYRIVSQIVTATGVGVVYISAWAAHGLFGLVDALTAFALIAAAAAFGVALAVAGRARILASLATVGGLLTPVVVDLPDVSPLGLYAFLLVLDAAVVAVAATRRWPEVGVIALLGTAVHTGLAFRWRWPSDSDVLWDAGFLLAAMLVFFGVALGFAWRRRSAPGPIDMGLMAAASLGGWAAGLVRLDPLGTQITGAWTVVVLLLEVAAAGVLVRRLGRDAEGRALFLALALVLLTALPPVVWDDAWVAGAWALEALVLGWAAIDRRHRPTAAAAALVAVAAAVACVLVAPDRAATPFLGVQAMVRLAATALLGVLLVVVERRTAGAVAGAPLRAVAGPAVALAALGWFVPELRRWAEQVDLRTHQGLADTAVGAAAAAVGLVLLVAWRHRPAVATSLTGTALVVCVLAWPASTAGLDAWAAAAVAAPLAWAGLAVGGVAWRRGRPPSGADRWIVPALAAAVAIAGLVRLGAEWPGESFGSGAAVPAALAALAAAALVLAGRVWLETPFSDWIEAAGWVVGVAAASRLLASGIALTQPEDAATRHTAVVALSVLWGGAGLALVLAGLVARHRARRLLGLALLAVTVAKVFLVDLAAAPTVTRIVAFLATGLALVGGSFLYARFRDRLGET